MAKNKIIVKKGKEKRIVQPSMIPEGFAYVGDYKAPVKAKAKPTTKKEAKK